MMRPLRRKVLRKSLCSGWTGMVRKDRGVIKSKKALLDILRNWYHFPKV